MKTAELETNAERLLMTNIIKASPGEDYESIEDELLKVQNDPAHVIIIDSMNEWSDLVSSSKEARIKELEEVLRVVNESFPDSVLSDQMNEDYEIFKRALNPPYRWNGLA